MNFPVPKYKVNDQLWFLNDKDNLMNGTVKSISLTCSEEHASVYYVMETTNKQHVVKETNIVDAYGELTRPKYKPSDTVEYTYSTKDKLSSTVGTITKVEVTYYLDGGCEVCYYMEDDEDYFVLEDEITTLVQDIPTEVSKV